MLVRARSRGGRRQVDNRTADWQTSRLADRPLVRNLSKMRPKMLQNEVQNFPKAQNAPNWGPKLSKMTTLDPPGTMTRILTPLLHHFIAHWGPKWSPKCFQNDPKSKLDFHDDFCFVLGRLGVPKRGYFRDKNRTFSLEVWKTWKSVKMHLA